MSVRVKIRSAHRVFPKDSLHERPDPGKASYARGRIIGVSKRYSGSSQTAYSMDTQSQQVQTSSVQAPSYLTPPPKKISPERAEQPTELETALT